MSRRSPSSAPAARPTVVKEDGRTEPFREAKLRRSLRRAGAARGEVAAVVDAVREQLRDGMSTRDLYRIARSQLRLTRAPTAARYGLQRALQDLGPSGFPFERFVAALWRSAGFETSVGVRMQGRFVTHEVDVVAIREDLRTLSECKLRTQAEGKIDVRVAMYVYGRAVDLGVVGRDDAQFWIVSNGRFTDDAVTYGEGMGLRLLGWNHPDGDGLRERIDRAGLHPITVLTTLAGQARRALLDDGLVLCRDVLERPEALARAGVRGRKVDGVLAEVRALCTGQ